MGHFVWTGAAAIALALSASPAVANCATDLSGNVTCTASGGTQTAPIGGGADSISVTIQSGATVDVSGSAPATAVDVHNTNAVVNYGALIGGDGSFGINAFDDNSITNFGTITVGGFLAAGIQVQDRNTAINNGTIIAGPTSPGIVAQDGNTITNNGTIITANSPGLFGSGAGILARDYNIIVNNGTLIGGDNNGTFGNSGLGLAIGSGNEVTNNGTIVVGANGFSILPALGIPANSNTIVNNGTIDGRVVLFGDGAPTSSNSFTNSGLLTITNGGTPYTFHFIEGTFIQTATGTLALRVSADTSITGFDQLAVFADAPTDRTALGGTLKMVIQGGGFQNSQTYHSIISFCPCFGGTIEGTFDNVTTTSPFFTATVIYGANDVDLTLTRIPFGSVPGMTPNQRTVGNALERAYSTGLTGNAATFYSNLLVANSVSVLDQLSGAGATAAQDASFSATGLFNSAMMQQGLAWLTGAPTGNSIVSGAPLGYAAEPRAKIKAGHEAFAAMQPRVAEPGRWRAWALGFGAWRSTDGDASLGTADQSTRTAGGAVGVEHQTGDLLLGVAAGGSTSHFSVSGLSTSGDIDGGHVGAYAFKSFGAAYAAATLNYAHFTNKAERTISGVGPSETATGRFDSDQLGGRFEVGWRKRVEGFTVTPFVAIEPSALWQGSYTESSTTTGGGAGVLGLSYSSHTTTSFPTFLGLQIDTRYLLPGGQVLSPIARVSWVHEFNPDRQVEASFVSIPSTQFTVDGARAARDSLRLDTGATLALNQNTALFANFSGEFSSISQMASATGGARVTW